MIYAASGEAFTALTDEFGPGLEGTLEISVDDLDGNTISGPTTAGIVELESGVYRATETAPVTLGEFALVWHDPGADARTVEALIVTSSSIAAVRRKIGDSDPANELLGDPDIQAALAAWPGNLDLAAAECAEAIAAKYARDFSFQTAEGQRFSRGERVDHYMALANTLRARGGAFVWPNPVTSNP